MLTQNNVTSKGLDEMHKDKYVNGNWSVTLDSERIMCGNRRNTEKVNVTRVINPS